MGGEGEGGGVDDRQGLQAGVCRPSHQRQVCRWGPGEEGRGVTLLSTWLVHTFHPLCRPVPIPTPGIQLTTLTHVEDVASMLAAVPGNKNAIGQVWLGGREENGVCRLDAGRGAWQQERHWTGITEGEREREGWAEPRCHAPRRSFSCRAASFPPLLPPFLFQLSTYVCPSC